MPDVRGSRTGSTAIRGGRGRTAYVYVGQRPRDLCGRPARSTQVRGGPPQGGDVTDMVVFVR